MSGVVAPLLESVRAVPAPEAGDAAARARRGAALDRAIADGLPSQRAERWKYTSLRALSSRRFAAHADTPSVHPAMLADIPAPRMVFVNGRFDAGLSRLDALPPGLDLTRRAKSAATAFADGIGTDGIVADGIGTDGIETDRADLATDGVHYPVDSFDRLNIGLAGDGACLRVDPGRDVTVPVHLVFVGAPADGDVASHLRHSISVGAGARLALVEHHLAGGPHRHLANQRIDVRLDAGAHLLHVRLQDEDAGATLIARTRVLLADTASLQRVDLELGAGLSRHDLVVRLEGRGARFESGGAMLASARRHLDTQLDIRHVARDTHCDLLWRGLAADRGRLAFHGGIHILAGADGAQAALSNKNLLLSDQAEIDTQPVLQIDADEVKAAHGATVGRLDAAALFYLRSRGLPEAEARALLTLAFCREALSLLGDGQGLLALVSPRLEARLGQAGMLPT